MSRHPHDQAPDCPVCKSNVYVACTETHRIADKAHTFECFFCGLREYQHGSRPHIIFGTENSEIYEQLGKPYK